MHKDNDSWVMRPSERIRARAFKPGRGLTTWHYLLYARMAGKRFTVNGHGATLKEAKRDALDQVAMHAGVSADG